MQIWNSSSSESKKCIICGKKSGSYKVYEESGISIKIPLCQDMYDKGCYYKVDVKQMTTLAIRTLKAEIKRQGEK
ncbi:hypothetical protein AB3N02_13930 [Priestia aryabhattai]|uniref:hypothetical protein n=1 Tax=Priestia aryabhattai TaxID=412384 RepID=UPI00399FF6B0